MTGEEAVAPLNDKENLRTIMKKFEHLSVLLDCSRNAVMSVSSVKKMIDYLSAMGYQSVQLYTEDTFELNGEPYFGYMRGRYLKSELKELDVYAQEKGIELIPCIQTLAHLNQMFRWSRFSEIKDFSEILLIDEPKTYEFIENMLVTVKECFSSRKINIGMDEANMVGLGKYLVLHGYVDRYELLIRHLKRVNQLLEKHGFEPMMWSDMFFALLNEGSYYNPSTNFDEKKLAEIPKNINLVYWDYYDVNEKHYEEMIAAHKHFDNNLWFAGGAWSWIGFTPHNAFSLKHFKAALPACEKGGIKNVIVTLWGDDGKECSYFSLLPTLWYVACYNKGVTDEKEMKEGFKSITGVSFDDFMALDLPDNVTGEIDVCNPSKYILFNDCLTGLFDAYVYGGEKEVYLSHAEKFKEILKRIGEKHEFAYLFRSQYYLSLTLAYKYEIGVRARKAYREKDKKELQAVVSDYKKLLRYAKKFYEAFRALWLKDNKPFGLEIQDARIGGLIARMQNCAVTLKEYLRGKTDKIAELDEDVLDFQCKEQTEKIRLSYNSWQNNVSANRM